MGCDPMLRLSRGSGWAQGASLLRVGFGVGKDGESSTGLQHQPEASDRAELHCRHWGVIESLRLKKTSKITKHSS